MPGVLEGLDRAEGHLVVVGADPDVDLVAGLEPVLGDLERPLSRYQLPACSQR
jgi:hypothetical protein